MQWLVRSALAPVGTGSVVAARENVSFELDAEVVSLLRTHASDVHVTEGEIVECALRAANAAS